jgi:hypothetical protein
MKSSAWAALWSSTYFEKRVSRVKRRMLIRMVRFWRSIQLAEM